jgi:hypothetical protein
MLLGQAFTALGLATPQEQAQANEPAQKEKKGHSMNWPCYNK